MAELFFVFLRLGSTSFGGPIAHLGYFREEFVLRRHWLDEPAYADLVALCQFLPGPASSQVGMAIGLSRAGVPGAAVAFLGFTLPSAAVLVLFAMSVTRFGNQIGIGWLHGLKVVAVAVVAQAVWGMGKTLAADRLRATIAVSATGMVTVFPSVLGQVAVIIASGLVGVVFLRSDIALPHTRLHVGTGRVTGAVLLSLFAGLLVILPLVAESSSNHVVKVMDSFYRAGSLVFGGGHVVLPLLQSQVVPPGWVSTDAFLAGYGAAQAIPGPLFTFAAYLGAVSTRAPSGWAGAALATGAIFLPAFLLTAGVLPFWEQLRRHASIQRAMLGINAAVVGVLLAAFYNPVWVGAINSAQDFCLALIAFLMLAFWKIPPWRVVILTATATGLGIG